MAEHFGVLALASPLLAIVLAMTTRQVLVSLLAGVWSGPCSSPAGTRSRLRR